jgi:LemA protein
MTIGIIGYLVIAVVAAVLIYIANGWIKIYNKFIYWRTRADRAFNDIDIIMQQRIDMLPALAQVAKKYSIHEWKTIKDTIEARSRWTKDHPNAPINQKVAAAQDIENNFLKIQTVFEKYPHVKADALYQKIMGSGNITRMEYKIRQFRLHYNKIAQDYNERVQRFPRNLVAKVHGFHTINYLTMGNQINQGPQETYKAKELFND